MYLAEIPSCMKPDYHPGLSATPPCKGGDNPPLTKGRRPSLAKDGESRRAKGGGVMSIY
jgi:hypothetical protein